MKVSVILCTYDPALYEHCADAIDSILSQTYTDVELVLVVDGSEELYRQIQDDYGDSGEVELELNEDNLGLLASRNRGAEWASGDVVAFIDDDAVADPEWITELVESYRESNYVAVGGKMTADWVAGKPGYLPEEFYWLVGVTHRGFADGPGEVRNTFGSNISFHRDVFLDLDGFDPAIGGRQGDANLQGGETELCARLRATHGKGVWYNPDAKVVHKVFDYRTRLPWLLNRAFWQGYSKRAMESLTPENGGEERAFLTGILTRSIPGYVANLFRRPSLTGMLQLTMLGIFTATVGLGYLYGLTKYR